MTNEKRVLVLQHEADLSVGSVGDWAGARSLRLEVLPASGGWAVPDLSPFAFVCSLGSHEHSFDDRLPWLERELELLRRAHEAAIPVFGICFGAQALARALGARTEPSPRPEIGWIEVELIDRAPIAGGPWLFWHEDRFEVPSGSELMARTEVGPAAFRVGASVGVQFHPEVSSATLERMIRAAGSSLDPETLDALRAGLGAEPERLRQRAWSLYDGFLERAPDLAGGRGR